MKTTKNIFIAFTLLIASALACNLPNVTSQQTAPDIQTAAAQTLQAILTPSITATVEQQSIVANNTATPTAGPKGTITPTYSVPMLTLREQTNCRAGPGQSYDILFAYVKGVKREIVGYYAETNYWLVKSPESTTGECWVWGEYADLAGSYWVVPSVMPPPTATMSLPTAPVVKWQFNCDYTAGQMNVDFTWTDNATNETGYRVIRNDQPVIELPADTTSYTDLYAFKSGEKVNYQIEVYNVTGSARSKVITVTC
jgi:SH3-like domain-containing protein